MEIEGLSSLSPGETCAMGSLTQWREGEKKGLPSFLLWFCDSLYFSFLRSDGHEKGTGLHKIATRDCKSIFKYHDITLTTRTVVLCAYLIREIGFRCGL